MKPNHDSATHLWQFGIVSLRFLTISTPSSIGSKSKHVFFQKFNAGASGREEMDKRIAEFGEEGESRNEEAAECDNWLCEVLAEH